MPRILVAILMLLPFCHTTHAQSEPPQSAESAPTNQQVDSAAEAAPQATRIEIPVIQLATGPSLEKAADDESLKSRAEYHFRRCIVQLSTNEELQKFADILDYQKPAIQQAVAAFNDRQERGQEKMNRGFEIFKQSDQGERATATYQAIAKRVRQDIGKARDQCIAQVEKTLIPRQIQWLRTLSTIQTLPKTIQSMQVDDISRHYLIATAAGATPSELENLKQAIIDETEELKVKAEAAKKEAIQSVIQSFPPAKRPLAEQILLGPAK